MNGNRIVLLRILASTIIGLTAMIIAGWLMHDGIAVPTAWWIIATLAVGGVAGADVVTAVLHARQEASNNDS
jgi:hypothetical protein